MKLGAGCALIALVVVANALLVGWAVMVLCGVLWHEFGWLEPIGYWPSVGIGALLSMVLGPILSERSS